VTMFAVVGLLCGDFAVQHGLEQLVLHRVHEQQQVQREHGGDQHREAGERQHQAVAQATARQAGCRHASVSSRKPTPCTVFSIGVANDLSSTCRSR